MLVITRNFKHDLCISHPRCGEEGLSEPGVSNLQCTPISPEECVKTQICVSRSGVRAPFCISKKLLVLTFSVSEIKENKH